ncbi:MAG: aminoglycoside 6-adenylyltransferase [Pseudomonadales bacterium]|nr:aminoglycoside 6-adenylyltransferase [Pseudomonadales bacterium]
MKTRTEKEMLALIIGFANVDDRVRTVLMNGSRANPNVVKDPFQDYDVANFVTDVEPFRDEAYVLPHFGEAIVVEQPLIGPWPPADADGSYHNYNMQLVDGNRIDLSFFHVDTLNDRLTDSLTEVLLDKDGVIPSLPPANESSYFITEPTRQLYDGCCTGFFFALGSHIPKTIWRKNLPLLKFHTEAWLRESVVMMLGPVDDQSPHTLTAITTSNSVIFKLKRSFLDLVQKLAASDNVMVTSMEETDESDSDWMSAMLNSHVFDFLPPANIQTLFSRFEEAEYKEGDTVITQGEVGDCFYVIKSGRAKVEYTASSKPILLAELETGAFFGEDALISDVPRNATITMLTNGTLMRLAEEDFEKLLQAPTIEKLKLEAVQEMIEAGDPLTWILDVRTAHEFQDNMIEDSINIPILKLRTDLGKLHEEAVYVVRSQGDKRAELAAFILMENGFDAYVLQESAA